MVLVDPRFSCAKAAKREACRVRPANMSTGILAMDPPEHARLRGLLTHAFTARRIGGLAEALVNEMTELGPPVDLVEGFVLPMSVTVIRE